MIVHERVIYQITVEIKLLQVSLRPLIINRGSMILNLGRWHDKTAIKHIIKSVYMDLTLEFDTEN